MRDAMAPSSRAVSYFQEIRRLPMLKAEHEYILTRRWREHGDGSAAAKLARGFSPRFIQAMLTQVGRRVTVGLGTPI